MIVTCDCCRKVAAVEWQDGDGLCEECYEEMLRAVDAVWEKHWWEHTGAQKADGASVGV